MKVNLKNSRLSFILTVFNVLLLMLSLLIRIRDIKINVFEHHILYAALNTSYIFMIMFLIEILRYVKEKTSVITSLITYACLQVLNLINNFFRDFSFAKQSTLSIGILTIVIVIYLTIETFKIKSSLIAIPYRLFALSLLSVIIIELIAVAAVASNAEDKVTDYLDILKLLTPLSILYIVKKANSLISETR